MDGATVVWPGAILTGLSPWRDYIRDDVDTIVRSGAPGDAAVPGCPGWAVDDVLRHLGSVHYRAGLIIGERRTRRPHRDETTAPPGDALDWLVFGNERLMKALHRADPKGPYVTFLGPKPLRWWGRRLANETAVHRIDVQQAMGDRSDVDPLAAADGIAEHFETYLPVIADRTALPATATLELIATDIGTRWRVTVGPMAGSGERADADTEIRGPATDLYLWLWGRGPLNALEVRGDPNAPALLRSAARV